MKCTRCDTRLKCIETRELSNCVYRRYRCLTCGEKYYSVEEIQEKGFVAPVMSKIQTDKYLKNTQK